MIVQSNGARRSAPHLLDFMGIGLMKLVSSPPAATGVARLLSPQILARPLIVLMIQLLFVVGSCSRDEPSGSAHQDSSGGRKTVGVSLLTMQHQFYQELRSGLESAGKERGLRLLIVSAEFDSARQANQLDEFIVQKVDAIVVCPCDSRSVGASVVAANQANIPVFTADIANTSPMAGGEPHCIGQRAGRSGGGQVVGP
jgi:ABC-type sugar transport system substrate-binding protein